MKLLPWQIDHNVIFEMNVLHYIILENFCFIISRALLNNIVVISESLMKN